MAPIAKEPEVLSPATSAAGSSSPSSAKTQPAAAEISVTVNGARTVEGSAKREPFSETTQTVLVFANGAVIRLSSSVAPGQLLFLTNEKSKKEVVCQVVKSKNYQSVSGYVELEFTEPAPGFWGMRFPTGSATSVASNLVKPIAPTPIAPVKTVAPAAPISGTPKISESKPAVFPEPVKTPPVESAPVASAPVVPAQPPANPIPVPTLSEFLTQAPENTETRPPEPAKTQAVEKNSDAATKELREHTARVQSQLSSMHFTQEPAKKAEPTPIPATPSVEHLSKALWQPEKKNTPEVANVPAAPVSASPAPGASTFDFEAEEVKIPAWLEPLARNSASVLETKAPETKAAEPKVVEIRHSEAKQSASPVSSSEVSEKKTSDHLESESSAKDSENDDAILTIGNEGPTPNFGSSLSMDTNSESDFASSGSGRGLIVGLLAAGLMLAAGGGWYWYSTQSKNVSANVAAPAASTSPATNPEPANSVPVNSAPAVSPNRTPATSTVAQPVSKNELQPSAAASKTNSPITPVRDTTFDPIEPAPAPAKKPSIGKVHLAAPVVNRTASSDNTPEPEPAIGGNVVSGAANGMNLLGSKSKQPTAPVPVGGDVRQAQLISAVPPVYPQMARSQRLSGNVTIDALIDANGRVTTMKVVSGPALLHQAAMDAVKQWKYKPATLNGQAMSMHLTVTVQFKLQ